MLITDWLTAVVPLHAAGVLRHGCFIFSQIPDLKKKTLHMVEMKIHVLIYCQQSKNQCKCRLLVGGLEAMTVIALTM